jgi:hypothetical protein
MGLLTIITEIKRFLIDFEMKKAGLKKTKLKILLFILLLIVIVNLIVLRRIKRNESNKANIQQLLRKEKLL